MFARFAMAAVAVTLLGASAYALAPLDLVLSEPQRSHVTIIEKNSIWPLKGRMSMHPCAVSTCLEA